MRLLITFLFLSVAAWGQFTSTAAHIRPVSSLPATCKPGTGDVVFKTTATIGVYQCLTTNTWTAVGTGGSTAAEKVRVCEIVIGDPGSASPVLANDNDSPSVCGNKTGATLTITAVECFADAGSPTVTPIITGGGSTTILSSALTCGTASFASGTLNGTPTQSNGGSIDGNITTAGGTAKYIVIRITRTL
jgi:hypothetical protein